MDCSLIYGAKLPLWEINMINNSRYRYIITPIVFFLLFSCGAGSNQYPIHEYAFRNKRVVEFNNEFIDMQLIEGWRNIRQLNGHNNEASVVIAAQLIAPSSEPFGGLNYRLTPSPKTNVIDIYYKRRNLSEKRAILSLRKIALKNAIKNAHLIKGLFRLNNNDKNSALIEIYSGEGQLGVFDSKMLIAIKGSNNRKGQYYIVGIWVRVKIYEESRISYEDFENDFFYMVNSIK